MQWESQRSAKMKKHRRYHPNFSNLPYVQSNIDPLLSIPNQHMLLDHYSHGPYLHKKELDQQRGWDALNDHRRRLWAISFTSYLFLGRLSRRGGRYERL